MLLIARPMIELSKLETPPNHGDVLVAPEPGAWIEAARANHESLRRVDLPLSGSTLAECRRRTREAITGGDDRLVFVIGHQPSFVHSGVWAKHVAASRAAAAADGTALNLVVDSDTARVPELSIPCVQAGRVILRSVSFAHLAIGTAFEEVPPLTPAETAQFEQAVREAMEDRYDGSQMPVFLAALSGAIGVRNWVDQIVSGRRAVEARFGIAVDDRCVSDVWGGPFAIDILVHAERFAVSYNRALGQYRREQRVRGARRPMPDLDCSHDRCEVAMWACCNGEPRRRLFVAGAGDVLRLFADCEEIGEIPAAEPDSFESLAVGLAESGGWRLRPRALLTSMWARLCLADLFIHGIGGAKYDRISDAIIADYYGINPPAIACVSATLHMDLPQSAETPETVRRLRRDLRDLEHNPQRHFPADPELQSLIERRGTAVRRAMGLRDHDRRNRGARRDTFDEIRSASAAILAARPDALAAGQDRLSEAIRNLGRNAIAHGREHFFCLYDRNRLEQLLGALPARRGFRV